jgi:hypothetical protein
MDDEHGRHLEAPVIRHEDPKDATRLADRAQAQPAKPWKQKHGTTSDR